MMERTSFLWSIVWLIGIVLVYAYGATTPAVAEQSAAAAGPGPSVCHATVYAPSRHDSEFCASVRRSWAD